MHCPRFPLVYSSTHPRERLLEMVIVGWFRYLDHPSDHRVEWSDSPARGMCHVNQYSLFTFGKSVGAKDKCVP